MTELEYQKLQDQETRYFQRRVEAYRTSRETVSELQTIWANIASAAASHDRKSLKRIEARAAVLLQKQRKRLAQTQKRNQLHKKRVAAMMEYKQKGGTET